MSLGTQAWMVGAAVLLAGCGSSSSGAPGHAADSGAASDAPVTPEAGAADAGSDAHTEAGHDGSTGAGDAGDSGGDACACNGGMMGCPLQTCGGQTCQAGEACCAASPVGDSSMGSLACAPAQECDPNCGGIMP